MLGYKSIGTGSPARKGDAVGIVGSNVLSALVNGLD